jgi:hypothetical protein
MTSKTRSAVDFNSRHLISAQIILAVFEAARGKRGAVVGVFRAYERTSHRLKRRCT